MESSCSPVIVNIFLNELYTNCINHCPSEFKPHFYKKNIWMTHFYYLIQKLKHANLLFTSIPCMRTSGSHLRANNIIDYHF